MKLFNLNPTYLNGNQFKVYTVAFWIVVISVICNMDRIIELLS